jgi:CRP/FNR family cyclic AMP-dependent transcriptional regulator
MTERIVKALRSIDLLAGLCDSLLAELEAFSMLRQIRAGETIFCQGEPSPYCFGIVSGQVTIQRVPGEKLFPSKTLGVLGPGAMFGEHALFKDTPRTAMAVASQNGELVAIQGKKFRDWLAKDSGVGVQLLMDMLESTMGRLRRTSQELSMVYGVGRALAGDGTLSERIRETAQFLRASLAEADEVQVYQRSRYWEEFVPLWGDALAIPMQHPLMQQLVLTAAPVVTPAESGGGSVAMIPLLDTAESHQPVQGFLRLSSRGAGTFTPGVLLLLTTVAVQVSEALTRQIRQDDQQARSRLDQGRQSFQL